MLTLYVCQPQHISWVISDMWSRKCIQLQRRREQNVSIPLLTRQVFMSKEFFLTVLRASVRSFSWSSVPATLPPFDCWEEEGGGLYGGWVGGFTLHLETHACKD